MTVCMSLYRNLCIPFTEENRTTCQHCQHNDRSSGYSKGQTFWNFTDKKGTKKMASQGYLNTSSLSCRRDFTNVLFFFFLSYNHFKWNYNHVSYGIVLPIQPNDTPIKARVHFIETEVKFIQASGSCWWLFRHFGVVRGPLWNAEVGGVMRQKHRCPWGGERWICRRVRVCVPGQVLPPISDDPLVGMKGEGVGGRVTIASVTMPDLFRIMSTTDYKHSNRELTSAFKTEVWLVPSLSLTWMTL